MRITFVYHKKNHICHVAGMSCTKTSDFCFQLKTDIELERAGIQFVPYQQLQIAVCKNTDAGPSAEHSGTSPSGNYLQVELKEEKEVEDQAGKGEGSDQDELESTRESESKQVENIKSNEPRKGTEVKLLGLRLGEGTATVVAKQITVSLQCSR